MARRDSSPDFVEAIARGLDVIRAFGPRQPVMSLAAVAAAAGLPRPTARRILLTLEELGYVRAAGGGFELTPRVLDLGGAVGHLQVRADRRDPLPGDEYVGVGQDPVPVVHGEHRRVAENQRPSRYQVRCRRHRNLHYRR